MALLGGDVVTTGVIVTELLRGILPAAVREAMRDKLQAVQFVELTWSDYAAAADFANECRNHGVQLATVDAILAQLAISRHHVLLTADRDFAHAAKYVPVTQWTSP